jgi:hypothetical protein
MKPFLIRLAKALLKVALDEGLRRGLPTVYKQLDAEVPLLLYNNAPPSSVQGAVASAISTATGHRASASQIEAVIGLYDPVKAALNRLR